MPKPSARRATARPVPAEAHDAHGLLVELALLHADRLAQLVVGRADRGVEAAGEREQQREGVLGEVDAHLALLAGERHVAVDQLGGEDDCPPRRRSSGSRRAGCASEKSSGVTRPKITSVSGSSRRWVALSLASTMRAPGPAASRMPARSASLRAGDDQVRGEEDLHGCGPCSSGITHLGARARRPRAGCCRSRCGSARSSSPRSGPAECGVRVTLAARRAGGSSRAAPPPARRGPAAAIWPLLSAW